MIAPSPATPPDPDGGTTKDLSIETLRGIAILLVVASHSILSIRVKNDSLFNFFYVSTLQIRMPVFAAIAGYVYSRRPVAAGRLAAFLKGKARRILLPFLTVGTARSIAHHFNQGGTVGTLPRTIFDGIVYTRDEFWFLQSVALCFLYVALAERAGALSTLRRWLAFLAASAAMRYFVPRYSVFSFDGFLFLIPFFLLGCGLPRYARTIFRPSILAVAWVAFLAGLASQQMRWWSLGDHRVNWSVVFDTIPLLYGLGAIVVAFWHRRAVPALAWVGAHSFPIYLFHSFALSVVHKAFDAITPSQRDVALLLMPGYLAAGLIFPVLVEAVLNRSRMTRLLFLGLGPAKPGRGTPPPDGVGVVAKVAPAS